MTKETTAWQAGQRVVIGRRVVVTVARVTPSGRAVVETHSGERTFEPNGFERKSGYRRERLEPLTPEIEAEIAHSARSLAVFRRLADVLRAAGEWERDARPALGCDTAEAQNVERAERLADAIEAIIKEAVA